jgi:hypothetical protein
MGVVSSHDWQLLFTFIFHVYGPHVVLLRDETFQILSVLLLWCKM